MKKDNHSLKYWRELPTQLPVSLLWSLVFCVTVLTIRILITGQSTYAFLFWNLFLAGIPLLISCSIMHWPMLWEKRASRWVLTMSWLLFIPNAFYLVTDLVHLDHFHDAPKWYDIALVFSFAWSGLMVGVFSMHKMEVLFTITASRLSKELMMGGVIFLISIGVYIGRVLRFNSWDLFSNPIALFKEIIFLLSHPFQTHQAWGTIILYSFLFIIVYRSFSMPWKLIKPSSKNHRHGIE